MTTLPQKNLALISPISLLVIGTEGVGKSSTINAMLGKQLAPVGEGVEPQTTEFCAYHSKDLILWDSPAINRENNLEFVDFLTNTHIDQILLLTDAGSRDLGVLFAVLSNTLLPFFNENSHQKITIALNHADIAMNGKGWDHETDKPFAELTRYLLDKVDSVAERVAESTGFKTQPLYFCSGFNDELGSLKPFQIERLMDRIVENIPTPVVAKSLWQRLLQWAFPQRSCDKSN